MSNGQIVQLQAATKSDVGSPRDTRHLQLRAALFSMGVTPSDEAGNTATVTVVPAFNRNGKNPVK